MIEIRTGRPRKRGSIPGRGNRYFSSPQRRPNANENKNPSAHKHVVLHVSWNPYIVASHLKILIPVGTAMVSSIGIVTCYGLGGPGIESRWGRDFLHHSRPALGPTRFLYTVYRVFREGKADGAWH